MTAFRPAATQLRLFASSGTQPTLDVSFKTARRVHLDATSWIDHVPGWLSRDDLLMETLASVAGWERRSRWMFTKRVEEPRLTAEYRQLREAPVPMLIAIGSALSKRYDAVYDSAWLNLYRNHDDSTGWHADRPADKREQAIVPVLSLGETRRFLIRRKAGGSSTSFTAVGGDLIVMGGRCQKDWVHCVPKESRAAGMRISVNFGSGFHPTYDDNQEDHSDSEPTGAGR